MTNCILTSYQFSPLNSKKILARFSNGDITSDSGLLLLREVDKKLGFIKNLLTSITYKRDAGYVNYRVEYMLKQRTYAIAAGYEDINAEISAFKWLWANKLT